MKVGNILFIVVFALLLFFSTIMNIFGDWFWFSSLGYDQVFLKILFTSAALGVIFGLSFFIFAIVNIKVAKKRSATKTEREGKKGMEKMLILLAGLFALMLGAAFSNWEVFLKFLNPSVFGIADPVFGLDISFYVFVLPFYAHVLGFILITIVLTIILTLLTYLFLSKSFRMKEKIGDMEVTGGFAYTMNWMKVVKKANPHLSFLLALLFFVFSTGLYLSRYGLLLSETGVVFGAGYTDIAVTLPLINILSALSAIVGLLFLLNTKRNKWKTPLLGLGALVGIAILGGLFVGVTQAFIVAPNEFNFEQPYIERNIEYTLEAYNLGKVSERIFPISYDLRMEDIEKNKETIGNIRLWDWRPLIQTYNQLQLFRTYYQFWDVDIDRYDIDDQYKQVMISARSMNTQNLPENAQTWVNKHLVYTHGYGVVMNPVDRVSKDGLPEFYIKDIPPASDYLTIERPEIYYGEGNSEYVVVKTTTEEFDYPSGERNIYTSYKGTGGVSLSDPFKRLVYAAKFGSIELLVSTSLTPESKILLHRDIKKRVTEIAPFLVYDRDPYVVVSGGRLFWIIDGYTITNAYPYSEPIDAGIIFNYIRNSVKVVVDAYNGDTKFYVIDKTDPLIQTYMKIFPNLFLDYSQMPEDLRTHIRYPEDLFRIQAELYSIYHMKDPAVFYSKEDAWVIPDEIYRGGRQKMEPYYVIMKLPEKERGELILMIPFTPKDKENLIAWMAAECDPPDYGNLVVYQFSKQVLTYGPMQIEARIDQDTEISQKITLWSQSGSSVIRGNTLVIPIDNSIIYIEPLYLEATEKGTLPQLKRVILAYGDHLTMQETLEQAISKIFGVSKPSKPEATPETPENKLAKISDLYKKAQEALKAGDLKAYADYIEQIGDIIS